jgi:hypothetical protein
VSVKDSFDHLGMSLTGAVAWVGKPKSLVGRSGKKTYRILSLRVRESIRKCDDAVSPISFQLHMGPPSYTCNEAFEGP